MASQEYKTNGKKGLFDEQFTIERLSPVLCGFSGS